MMPRAALVTLAALLCPLFASAQAPRAATPGEALKVPPGFKAELLHSAKEGEGSWVCIAVDDKGRLYVSPQADDQPLLRVTLTEQGKVEKLEPVPLKVGGAMGMLWAFDSLYVSGAGPGGRGIYRLRDTNGDDVLDDAKLFKAVPNGHGEHGAHAIVLGPDNKLYFAHGNSTPLIDGVDVAASPYKNYQEDYLLPRVLDPVATFFDKLKVPYGHVLRTDENGTQWELFAGGFRNQYDIDFNADGELFTFDSDMEWDVGLPWYKPTRILHITSGADFGFREGSTKWPAYYPDSLGAVVDVGLGSPTGVKFGTKSNFPDRYKKAFYAMDWTYGRILAVHMKPAGATYAAENKLPNPYYLSGPNDSPDVEVFLSGKAMPVNDLEFGKDGAMYFTVGGRGTQAGLYRVSYVGPASDAATEEETEDPLVAVRHGLETFHVKQDPRAVEVAWPHLGSNDRHVRFAARLAIENQPVQQWRQRALDESDPQAAMTALLALARLGPEETQEPLLKALAKFPMDSLNEPLKLEKLRIIQLSFIRQGRPSQAMVDRAVEKLSKQYPANSFALNRELSQLLVWLGAPDATAKTLALLQQAQDPAEQIWYAYVLRSAKHWTPEQRLAYFSWFPKAEAFKGGNSFAKFIVAIRDLALANVPADQKERVAAAMRPVTPTTTAVKVAARPVVQRDFQRTWTMADLEPELPKVSGGRNFERGKEIFSSLQCLACHRFNNEGGGVGPDISAVANRFGRRDILESIVEPSKVISEQYVSYVVRTKKGETFSGQVVEENNDHLILVTDPLQGTRKQIGQTGIAVKKLSPISAMPANLIDVLTKEEVLDLLAYIESGGNKSAAQFTATPAAAATGDDDVNK